MPSDKSRNVCEHMYDPWPCVCIESSGRIKGATHSVLIAAILRFETDMFPDWCQNPQTRAETIVSIVAWLVLQCPTVRTKRLESTCSAAHSQRSR